MTDGIDFSDLIPPASPPAEGQTGLPPGFQLDTAPAQPAQSGLPPWQREPQAQPAGGIDFSDLIPR
ncbi:MAG TPA: hypothetical protein VGF29_04075 [Hyphomicrobiaceae bacterium]|jgi:hypothetical protein